MIDIDISKIIEDLGKKDTEDDGAQLYCYY